MTVPVIVVVRSAPGELVTVVADPLMLSGTGSAVAAVALAVLTRDVAAGSAGSATAFTTTVMLWPGLRVPMAQPVVGQSPMVRLVIPAPGASVTTTSFATDGPLFVTMT